MAQPRNNQVMNDLMRSRRSAPSRTSVSGTRDPVARAANRELRRAYFEGQGDRVWSVDSETGKVRHPAREALQALDEQEREDRQT